MKPLIFAGIGEVLYDVFEDGHETLGGAPLNFTVHAHRLAGQLNTGVGIIISCIGTDHRGDKILDALRQLRMSNCYVGKDPDHPTGLVSVFMKNREPGYQIEEGVAWDFITDDPSLRKLASQCSAICFGSLAQRSSISRNTIRNFLQHAPQAIRLYDVNLRQNTLTGECAYTPEIIEYGCQTATIIKANRYELFAILDLLGIDSAFDHTLDGISRGMDALLMRFPAQSVVITRGEEGTIALTRGSDYILSPSVRTEGTIHPVGAGDACSAGILFGTALGWNMRTTMELANRMGADVLTHPSATPPLSNGTLRFVNTHLQDIEPVKS